MVTFVLKQRAVVILLSPTSYPHQTMIDFQFTISICTHFSVLCVQQLWEVAIGAYGTAEFECISLWIQWCFMLLLLLTDLTAGAMGTNRVLSSWLFYVVLIERRDPSEWSCPQHDCFSEGPLLLERKKCEQNLPRSYNKSHTSPHGMLDPSLPPAPKSILLQRSALGRVF